MLRYKALKYQDLNFIHIYTKSINLLSLRFSEIWIIDSIIIGLNKLIKKSLRMTIKKNWDKNISRVNEVHSLS